MELHKIRMELGVYICSEQRHMKKTRYDQPHSTYPKAATLHKKASVWGLNTRPVNVTKY